MGKKPFGKRLLRLDKVQRAAVSGGSSSKDQQEIKKDTKSKGSRGKKGSKPPSNDMRFGETAPQLHAIKRMIQTGMAGPRKLGTYSNSQRILLVGEGDFSFALSLASIIGGTNIVCTSLDKLSQLQVA